MGKTGGFSKAFGLRRAAVLAAALAGLLLALEVSAQGVKPSTTAPKANQPTAGGTTTSSTGKSVPSINIVAPNSAGVSHNIYNQFNVGPNGLILNNATQAGQSQIGGQLGANPNFTGGNYAKLILNEVTGGSASSLQGYIEIFGHSADFILANPAGVTCNGCGFINTPRVTLTTGTPNLDANGGLSGFTVGGSGQISIEGTVDITGVRYFDVAARSIFVGGEIGDSAMQAEVGLFAGRNNFDYNARTATALADDGSTKPAFGIDASAGSIKAGKIAAQSTEKGVGMRTGNLQAGAGGMMLTADGKLVLAKTQSQGAISAKSVSGDIQAGGQLWSQASLDLWAGGNISLLAQVSAGALGNVSVTAQGLTLNEGAVLGAGLDAATGNFTGGGALTLAAASLWNAGTMHATQNVTLGLTGVLNNQATGTIQAGGTLTVNAASLQNYGSANPGGPQGTISGQMLVVNAGDIANAGKLLASQALTIASSGQVMNALGTIQAGGRLSITATGNVENLSGVIQGQDVAINAQTIDNVTLVSSNGQLTLPTEFAGASSQSLQALFGTQNGAFLNGLGVPLGGAAAATPKTVSWFGLDLAAVGQGSSSGTAAQQAQIGATNGVTLNASKDINSVGGKLGAGTDLNLNAGGSVSIQAAELTGTSSSTTHLGSALTAGGNVTVNAGGDVTVQGSTVTAGKNAQINAQGQVTLLGVQDEVKTDTRQKSCGWFGLDCSTSGSVSDTVTALAATVNAGGWVQIKGKDIAANGGNIGAQGSVTLTASGSVVNMLGTIAAGGGVTINAGGNFENLSGTVQGTDVTINAQTIENVTLVRRDGTLILPQQIAALFNANTSAASTSPAAPSSEQALLTAASGSAGSLVNGTQLGALGVLFSQTSASSAHTDVAAQQASIGATNGVTLNARQDINNVGGKLAATNGDLTLNASGNVNVQAQELSTVQDANNSTTTHVKSALSAGGNVTINAGGDATIQATDIKSGKNTQINAQGAVTLGAAQDETKTYSSHHSCDWFGWSCSSSSTSTDNVIAVTTTINSGGWVQIESKTKDIQATATTVNAQGYIKLLADLGNVIQQAGQNSSYSHSSGSDSQWWGLTGSSHSSTDSSTTIAPSFISAVHDVQIVAHADFVLKGSGVKAGGSIFITAQNIDLIALQNTTYHSQMDENWGFYASASAQSGSASVGVGWQDTKTTSSTMESLAQVSTLEAGGNIAIDAKGDINSQGAIVAASGDLTANAGGNVNLTAAYDSYTATSSKSSTQIGLTLSANENITSAIKTFENAPQAFNAGQGSATNKGITQASEALQLVETAANLVFGQLVSVSASIGFSHSTSESSLTEHLAHAGYWVAGNDVSIASGNNVNIEGTVSQAGRCLSVAAANNLTIQSALSTVDQKTSFQSESASVGVSAGVGLTGFSLAGNASVGFQTGDSSMHQVTNVMSQLSGGAVTLKSGRDTTVAGATVTGGTVTADVGGNLSVESRQDTLTSRNSQTGFSLGIGIGLGSVSSTTGPGSYAPNTNFLSDTGQMFSNAGSFLAQGGPFGNAAPGQLSNVNNGNTPLKNTGSIGFTYVRGSEDKAWTNNLTTIDGTSGTTLNVAGNSNVKGAVIESSGGGPLAVNTGTFTYQNLQDYDRTQNINASFNVTIPLGSFGWQQNAPAPGGTPTAGAPAAAPPPSPSMLAQLGQTLGQIGQALGKYPAKFQLAYTATDKEGITYATVGQGNINVSDTAKQAALEKSGATGTLAKLNRDVTKTQIVTKNTTEAFNVFVSTQSLGTIATLASKAVAYIDDLVNKGIMTLDEGARVKKVLDYIAANGMPIGGPCDGSGGSAAPAESGSLFNLRNFIIAPAYAEGSQASGCKLIFTNSKFYSTDPATWEESRWAITNQAAQALSPENLARYNDLQAQVNSGQISSDNPDYVNLKQQLLVAASIYELCNSNPGSLRASGVFDSMPSLYNDVLFAEAVRRGGDLIAANIVNGDQAAFKFSTSVIVGDIKEFPLDSSGQLRSANTVLAAFMLAGINASTPGVDASTIMIGAMSQLRLAMAYPDDATASQRIQAAVDIALGGLTADQKNNFYTLFAFSGLQNWVNADVGNGVSRVGNVISPGQVAAQAGAYLVLPAQVAISLAQPEAAPFVFGFGALSGGTYVARNELEGLPVTFQGFAYSSGAGSLVGLSAWAAPVITAGVGAIPTGWAGGQLIGAWTDVGKSSDQAYWNLKVETGLFAGNIVAGGLVAKYFDFFGSMPATADLTINTRLSPSAFENAQPWVVAPTEGQTGTPYGVVFRVGAPAAQAEAGTGGAGQWAVQTGSGTVLVDLPAGYRPSSGTLSSAGSVPDGVARVVGPDGEFQYLRLSDNTLHPTPEAAAAPSSLFALPGDQLEILPRGYTIGTNPATGGTDIRGRLGGTYEYVGQTSAASVTPTGDVIPAGSIVYGNSGKYWVFTPDQKLSVTSGSVSFAEYTFNSAVNPGPLADMPGFPSKAFFGGQYDASTVGELPYTGAPNVLFRAGDSTEPFGRWYTLSPADSIAQVRLDMAVKPQWFDQYGGLTGSSPIDTVWGIRFVPTTPVYVGPPATQGGPYLGGPDFTQLFIPLPKGFPVDVVSETPIK